MDVYVRAFIKSAIKSFIYCYFYDLLSFVRIIMRNKIFITE